MLTTGGRGEERVVMNNGRMQSASRAHTHSLTLRQVAVEKATTTRRLEGLKREESL